MRGRGTVDRQHVVSRGASWSERIRLLQVSQVAGEAVTEVLREEVAAQGIRVMAVEPGAFRTRAYAGFADEPITETISEYTPMLEQVRAAMIDQDGIQPGDPRRGARAVIAAMAQDPPPDDWSSATMDSTLRSPPSRRTSSISARTKPSHAELISLTLRARFVCRGETKYRPADFGAPARRVETVARSDRVYLVDGSVDGQRVSDDPGAEAAVGDVDVIVRPG